jgi:hypothetical protein
MKPSDLFNSNDYQRGFNEGKAAALASEDKNYIRSGISLKFAVHGSHAIDTYNKGYNDGYETAMKAKLVSEVSQNAPIKSEIINNNNNHISTSMAKRNSQHSFAFQIELAEDLKRYLHGFQDRLGVIAENYKTKYENLGNVMMEEFHEQFSENYEDSIKIISDLVDQINDNDIPYVEKYIDYLESNPSA